MLVVSGRIVFGDVTGGVLGFMLIYLGVKAMQEQSPVLYWLYLIPCVLEGLSMLAAWSQLRRSPPAGAAKIIGDNPLRMLPSWLLLATAFVDIASAQLAARLSSKIYKRNMLAVDYVRPDSMGQLVYTRGESISDLTHNAAPQHIEYNAVSLSSSDEEGQSPRDKADQPEAPTKVSAV